MNLNERSAVWQRLVHDYPASLNIDEKMIFENFTRSCNSPVMQRIFALVKKLQIYKTPVMLTGEAGVGKDFWARVIHHLSVFGKGPFVRVDADHVPAEFLEYLLFGDSSENLRLASANYPGKIREAAGGTLFICEIQYLPLKLQERLLHVIQKRQHNGNGSNGNGGANGNGNGDGNHRAGNLRIMVSTTQKPEDFLKNGNFRRDLFYRLSIFPIELPPLRERQEDLPALLELFIQYYSSLYGKQVTGVDSSSLNWLQQYYWPGNLDELREFILLNVYSAPPDCSQIKLCLFPDLSNKEGVLVKKDVSVAALAPK